MTTMKTIEKGTLLLVVVVGILVIILVRPKPSHTSSESNVKTTNQNLPSLTQSASISDALSPDLTSFPLKSNRLNLTISECVAWLEKLGQVPLDADMSDWELAQRTSWWGRRLKADEFWRRRTVWLDEAAELAAKRHGRMYPPMPFEDPELSHYTNDKDVEPISGYAIEGLNLHYHLSERENAFWDKFRRTRPRPPKDLEREQFRLAERLFTQRFDLQHRDNPGRTSSERIVQRYEIDLQRSVRSGFPKESFTEDALLWAHASRMQTEYQQLFRDGHDFDSPWIKNFLNRLVIDQKYLTLPLTSEEAQTANSWKSRYLQRLRESKLDESYINAYLKAWNLSATQVFSESRQQ